MHVSVQLFLVITGTCCNTVLQGSAFMARSCCGCLLAAVLWFILIRLAVGDECCTLAINKCATTRFCTQHVVDAQSKHRPLLPLSQNEALDHDKALCIDMRTTLRWHVSV